MGEPQFLKQSRLTGNKQSQHFRSENKRNKNLFLAHRIAHCELAERDFVPHNSLRPKLAEGPRSLLLTLLWVLKSSWSLKGWWAMWVIVQGILGVRPGSGNILSTHIPLSRTNPMFSSYCMRDWVMWLGWVPRRKMERVWWALSIVSALAVCDTAGAMAIRTWWRWGAGMEKKEKERGSDLGKWTLKQLWKSSVWTSAKLMSISLQSHGVDMTC